MHSTVMDFSSVADWSEVLFAAGHCLIVHLEVSRIVGQIDRFGCLRRSDALDIDLRLEVVAHVALIHPQVVRSGKFR